MQKYENDEIEPFKLHLIARNYYMLGKLKRENALSSKAIEIFKKIIDLNLLNNQGVSHIWWYIANSYFDMEMYKEATKMYDKSIELYSFPLAKIDKAHTLLFCEDYQESKRILHNNKLGHSSITLTADIYSHILPNKKRDAIEKLKDIF